MSALIIDQAVQTSPLSVFKSVQTTRDIVTGWLTLDEIANQLNLFSDQSQDTYLQTLDLAARMAIEDYLGLAIFDNAFSAYFAVSSAALTPVHLLLPEVSQAGTTISSVKYYDGSQVLQTLATANYFFDVTGNQVVVTSLPSTINTNMAAPVQVNWVNKGSVIGQYPVVKQAGLLLVTHLYNNRADTSDKRLYPIPFGMQMLLKPYKPLVM